MVGEGYAGLIDTCQILAVPKDIDALISMGFGLVQAALTTEYSISNAAEVGIEVIGVPIEKDKEVKAALNTLLPTIDALWLISDPVVLAGTERVKEIFTLCDAMKKPVFAYDKLFANFGAALIISADIATMGKQAAKAANNILNDNKSMEKVQNPAGSSIAINVKKLEQYGIPLEFAFCNDRADCQPSGGINLRSNLFAKGHSGR